jgi:SAM-dependent methyltransferase
MEEVKMFIPDDSSKQMNLLGYLTYLKEKNSIELCGNILDFGCGKGDTYKEIEIILPSMKWFGIDLYEDIAIEKVIKKNITIYNGEKLPYNNNFFDIIISNQVFEHVENPFTTILEIDRVLKPNGVFIGSVSQLEPYHAKSVFNFTPYGMKCLMKNTTLEIMEFRPGIDAFTLLIRALFGKRKYFNRYWTKESPLNRLLSIYGKLTGKSHYTINYHKLYFAGQFCFYIRKK